MVDFGSSSPSHHHHLCPCHPFHFQLHVTTWKVAPPLYWGMWARSSMPASIETWNPTAPAPPLLKGMWATHYCSTKDLGREIHKGRPKKWEAQPVHPENEPWWRPYKFDNDDTGLVAALQVQQWPHEFDVDYMDSMTTIKVQSQPYQFNNGHTGLMMSTQVQRWW